jgi:hypothetical protein
MLNAVMLNVMHVECCYAECNEVKWCSAECNHVDCYYAGLTECLGTITKCHLMLATSL